MNLKRTLAILAISSCVLVLGYSVFQTSQAQTIVTTISGKFYKLDILATNTSTGVPLLGATSLNDNGVVAFSSQYRLFTADGISTVRTIDPGFTNTREFDGGLQINNNGLLLAFRGSGTGVRRVMRYDTTLAEPSETTIATSSVDFRPARMSVTMNNHSQVQQAFYATPLAGPPQQLVTGLTGSFNGLSIATDPIPADSLVSPMIADDGNVVARAGTTNLTDSFV